MEQTNIINIYSTVTTVRVSPWHIKFRNSWQCQKCSLMRGGDTYLATGGWGMSGIRPRRGGSSSADTWPHSSHIRRVLCYGCYQLSGSAQRGPHCLHAATLSDLRTSQTRLGRTNIKTCNFASIVSLINYGFTAIFLSLREKIRLHILISQY